MKWYFTFKKDSVQNLWEILIMWQQNGRSCDIAHIKQSLQG